MNSQQAEQESFICRFIKRDPHTMMDIGVGPKTECLTLKEHYPNMQLIGVEPLAFLMPDKESFPGELFEYAISGSPVPKKIFYNPDRLLNASLIPDATHTQSKYVPSMRLDELDKVCEHPKRILLWLDIEGSELKVLKSGVNLLKSNRVRWINLEERRPGHEKPGWCTSEEVRKYLRDLGYIRLKEYNKHKTHQDVLYLNQHEKGVR